MADLGFAICELRFAIWELGILINPQTFRPSDLQTFRPSDLQTFRPTDLQTFSCCPDQLFQSLAGQADLLL